MSRHQNGRKNDNINIGNKFFERMMQFRYLGTALTNQNSIREEIKSRLKSENAFYHSFAECFVFQFAIQHTKIKIHRTVILPVVLRGCETWSLTLRAERRLRVFENRVLRRIFDCKRDEVKGEWRKFRNKLNDLQCHQIIFGR